MNAIFTIRTNKTGAFRGWPDSRSLVSFVTYSVQAIRRHYKNAILYTDSVGKSLFKNSNFDDIVVSLDEFDICPDIYNACKLGTYTTQNEPFVHLDWDFILWRSFGVLAKSKIVAQSRENNYNTTELAAFWRQVPWKPDFIEDILSKNSLVELPCAAFLSVVDTDFIKWYSGLALEILRHPKNESIQGLARTRLNSLICLAIEGWLLSACAHQKGVKIDYLSSDHTASIKPIDPKDISQFGFARLQGESRLSEAWALEIKKKGALHRPSGKTEKIDVKSIPYKVLISLEKHEERRASALKQLDAYGIEAEWQVPVPISETRKGSAYTSYSSKPSSASHAATIIKILQEVRKSKASHFLMFEDDIVVHKNFGGLVAEIDIPQDWKFIYLGGRNCGIKTLVTPGLTRSTFAVDLHAVIIKSDIIDRIEQVLMDPCINSVYLDFRIATLHREFPAYLCRPNLIWQCSHAGDHGLGEEYSNYHEDGTVKNGQGD